MLEMTGPILGGRSTFWNEEREAELRKLLTEEHLSAGQVAARMGHGITRNAIIGKALRMHIPLANKQGPSSARVKAENPVRVTRTGRFQFRKLRVIAPPDAFLPICEPVTPSKESIKPRHISLIDLRPNACRWPYGEHAPFTFCGHDAIGGKIRYCPYHFRKSRRVI